MYKKAAILGILAAILLSLSGCFALNPRTSGWAKDREKYDLSPPYMGVKYILRNKSTLQGVLIVNGLPLTFVLDTFLLPWDLSTILSEEIKRTKAEKQ